MSLLISLIWPKLSTSSLSSSRLGEFCWDIMSASVGSPQILFLQWNQEHSPDAPSSVAEFCDGPPSSENCGNALLCMIWPMMSSDLMFVWIRSCYIHRLSKCML